jgi:hypothetical protein
MGLMLLSCAELCMGRWALCDGSPTGRAVPGYRTFETLKPAVAVVAAGLAGSGAGHSEGPVVAWRNYDYHDAGRRSAQEEALLTSSGRRKLEFAVSRDIIMTPSIRCGWHAWHWRHSHCPLVFW